MQESCLNVGAVVLVHLCLSRVAAAAAAADRDVAVAFAHDALVLLVGDVAAVFRVAVAADHDVVDFLRALVLHLHDAPACLT